MREQGIGKNDQRTSRSGEGSADNAGGADGGGAGGVEKDTGPPSATVRQGHLALLKRWYYRPEVKREGEICFPDEHGQWPIKSMLRAAGAWRLNH